METRRENLKILAAISATCAFPFSSGELFGQQSEVHPTAKYLTESELRLVTRISDLIIPNTDTPGAVAAGVPAYIDSVIAGNPALQKLFRTALPLFGQDFLEKSEPEQLAILEPLCNDADLGHAPAGSLTALFRDIKNLTCDGYYTSRTGLIQELGYAGNMPMGAFPACELHEH